MARAVWFDKGMDAAAVADHLEECAQSAAAPLVFQPVPLPPGCDLKVLHRAATFRARRHVAASHGEGDRILAQEVRALDDLIRSSNLLVERLREWYALHAPEATRLAPDAEQLARLVADHGERGAVLAVLKQTRLSSTSLGSDLAPDDLAAVQTFASALAGLHDAWHAVERRVEALMGETAPNLASVTGPLLGARLIAQAGSLERLAGWPAGTVQLLGAEAALFRHLKEGNRPPKHGILFQHPLVHGAPPGHRGPIARALALAASTAAKADAFTKRDLSAELKARVQADLDRIKARPAYPRPRGPPMGKPWGRAPPRTGPPRAAPPRGGPPPRGPGPGSAPPREGQGWRGPPSRGPPSEGAPRRFPGAGGPPAGAGSGKTYGKSGKPYRKPAGAFRRPNKPAPPPGKGGG